jgi:hypothetical protein
MDQDERQELEQHQEDQRSWLDTWDALGGITASAHELGGLGEAAEAQGRERAA